MSLRSTLKKFKILHKLYFFLIYLRNIFNRAVFNLNFFNQADKKLLRKLKSQIQNFYPKNLDLKNPTQFYCGKNIIGYPALANITKAGKQVGWAYSKLEITQSALPFLQVEADLKINIPKLFEHYKPNIILDFGTASGGSAVFFYEMAKKYCNPRILSVDISDKDFKAAGEYHTKNESTKKISFLIKNSLDCFEEVKSFLQNRQPGEKVLVSFDDNHDYIHTYKELEIYSKLLEKGDIILMQDTWDQSLYTHETSPMLAVFKFLTEHTDFEYDLHFLKNLELPCNFIHGVIIKK